MDPRIQEINILNRFSVKCYVVSGTIGEYRIIVYNEYNEEEKEYADLTASFYGANEAHEFDYGTFEMTSDLQDMLTAYSDPNISPDEEDKQYEPLADCLNEEYGIKEFHLTTLTIIGIRQNLEVVTDQSTITRKITNHELGQALADYVLNGVVSGVENILEIPYKNAQNGFKNSCVLNYILKLYPRLSPKIVKKFIPKTNCKVRDIQAWAQTKKIPCILFDIFGSVLWKSSTQYNRQNAKKKVFGGVIYRNHLYPLSARNCDRNDGYLKAAIEKSDSGMDSGQLYEETRESVRISLNGRLFTYKGVASNVDSLIDIDFFKNIPLNFFYESENKLCDILPLSYRTKQGKGRLTRIDMNKAYYNVLKSYNGSIPCFSVSDTWQKFERSEKINELYYYSVKENAMPSWFQTNIAHGFIINELIRHNQINYNDIEYFKAYSQGISAKLVNTRLKKVRENLHKRFLKGHEDGIFDQTYTEEDFENRYRKGFALYNGILGKKSSRSRKSVSQCTAEDYKLLKIKYEHLKIAYDLSGGKCEFLGRKEYKHLNHRNIYNFVVDLCNLSVLEQIHKNMDHITDLREVKTDSITYEGFKITPPTNWKYEEVPNNQLPEKTTRPQRYFDVYDQNINILEEIAACSRKNLLVQGAPGTGKTYSLKYIHHDLACTISNLCKINLGQNTEKPTYTFYSLFKCFTPQKILTNIKRTMSDLSLVVDEFSMLNSQHMNIIYMARLLSLTNVIFLGDINQIAPVKAEKMSMNSPFIKTFFPNQRFLTTDYRNDISIQELREMILKSPSRDVYLRMHKYNKINNRTLSDLYNSDIVITHTKKSRDSLNREILRKRRLTFSANVSVYNRESNELEKVFTLEDLEYRPELNKYRNKLKYRYSVEYKISPGVRLYCKRKTTPLEYDGHENKNLIHKGDILEVIRTTPKRVIFKSIHTKITHSILKPELTHFDLGFVVNVHLCQGLTLDGKISIVDISSMFRFSRSLLYTAVTRARSVNQLNFVTKGDEVKRLRQKYAYLFAYVKNKLNLKTELEEKEDRTYEKVNALVVEKRKMFFERD